MGMGSSFELIPYAAKDCKSSYPYLARFSSCLILSDIQCLMSVW